METKRRNKIPVPRSWIAMRKKFASMSILLLVLSVLTILNVDVTRVSATGSPVIRVEPAEIIKTGWGVGTNFTVSIYTNYTGGNITSYQFALSYNPLVLKGVNVTNGDLITNETHAGDAVFLPGTFNNTLGELELTAAYFEGKNVTNGDGILANVTFTVMDYGDSDIIVEDETKLVGWDAVAEEEYSIIDYFTPEIGLLLPGYFRNVASAPTHDVAVISVAPNATEVLASELVNINITVSNNGDVNENFEVKAYYGVEPNFYLIGTQTVWNLTDGTDKNLTISWDTAAVSTGTHTIKAEAGPVRRETNTADNTDTSLDNVTVLSASIAVVPDSIMNAALTEGNTFTVSIYTDYDGAVISRTDVWGYELTLTYNGSILDVDDVANGGNLEKTDTWVGNSVTTVFTTTEAPIIPDSEEIYVNQTLMTKPDNYTINDATGAITFTTPPDVVYIKATYMFNATLMNSANFTAGTPSAGTLSLTSNNVSTTVTGPGVLATVTFNVTGIGDTDITLGPETRLIRIDGSNITLPQLEHGFFTNGVDLYVQLVVPGETQAYPSWTNPMNVKVVVANSRGLEVGPFNVTLYYDSTPIETQSAAEMEAFGAKMLQFNWTPTGLPWGLYNITANVTVLNDINPANDILVYSAVKVAIPGDIDGDTKVDKYDFGDFAGAYGSKTGEHRYLPEADLDNDGDVDKYDFGTFAGNFGKSTTAYPPDP